MGDRRLRPEGAHDRRGEMEAADRERDRDQQAPTDCLARQLIRPLTLPRPDRLGDEHGRADRDRAEDGDDEENDLDPDADARDRVVAEAGDEQRVDRADRRLEQVFADDGQRETQHAPLRHRLPGVWGRARLKRGLIDEVVFSR